MTHPVLRALPVLVLALAACSKKSSPTGPTITQKTTHSSLNPASSTSFEARTSQIVTNGASPAQLFDDVTFTGATTIRTVSWQGVYCVQANNAPAPSPTATSFVLGIYPDASGRPNTAAPLQTVTLTLAQANQVFDKNVGNATCGSATNVTYAFYNYSATLPTAFTATPGVKYWVSVQAVTPSYGVYWGWRNGVVDNSLSIQLFEGNWTTYAFDRAYALNP